SVKYLRFQRIEDDDRAVVSARAGFFFGLLGLLTGMLWANATWGTFWTSDPKLNNTAIGLLISSAYFVLRGSFADAVEAARLSAVYNIFAFMALIPLIFILPRMTDSLHPGSGDNPTFRLFDTSHDMKLVIYIAITAFILLGWWIMTILLKLRVLTRIQDDKI